MRRFAWAAIFGCLALAALGFRYLHPPPTIRADDQMMAAARSVMETHGYAFTGLRPLQIAAGRWLTFRHRGCAGTVGVVVVDPAQVIAMTRLIPAGDAHEYAYLGWRSTRFDRTGILRERLSQAAAGAMGLSAYAASPNVLLITWPASCQAVRGVDWGEAWRLTGPAAAAAAATPHPEV